MCPLKLCLSTIWSPTAELCCEHDSPPYEGHTITGFNKRGMPSCCPCLHAVVVLFEAAQVGMLIAGTPTA